MLYIKAGAASMAGAWFIHWCGRCVVYTDRLIVHWRLFDTGDTRRLLEALQYFTYFMGKKLPSVNIPPFRISPHHGSILSLRLDLNLSIWTRFWGITVVFLLTEACYYFVRVNITLYLWRHEIADATFWHEKFV